MGAWIEILSMRIDTNQETVAPLVGAWIEIQKTQKQMQRRLSLLSWERGLKFIIATVIPHRVTVAPLVGAWIEMAYSDKITGGFYVAPLVGAWIEISQNQKPKQN